MLRQEILEIGKILRIGQVRIHVLSIEGNDVKLGVEAPPHLIVLYSTGQVAPDADSSTER